LRYTQPWKARRLAMSIFTPPPPETPAAGRGGNQAQAAQEQQPPPPPLPEGPHIKDDTGTFNPVLGYSYEEIAGMSRSMHRSQGMGNMGRLGSVESEFIIVGGETATRGLFEAIDTSWNRLPAGHAVGEILTAASKTFDPAHPENTVPELMKARALVAAIDDPLAKIKLRELDEAVAQCTGLWADVQAKTPEITPGATLNLTATLLNRSSVRVSLESARFEGMFSDALPVQAGSLEFNKSKVTKLDRQVPASQQYTQPYWLAKPASGDDYVVDDQSLIGLADNPPVLRVRFRLSIDGSPFELERPVQYRYADRTEGERVRPLAVVPPVAVNFPVPVAIFPKPEARKLVASVRANVPKAAGELRIEAPAGWKVEPQSRPFDVAAAGEQQELSFVVTPPQAQSLGSFRAVAHIAGREIASGMQLISYPHIPDQVLLLPSDAKLVRSDIQVSAKRIGYIMGAGDEMPDALRQLGLEVTVLSPSDLEQGELSRFDAIVAGVRAYNVRSDVRANQQRLLDYVKNGGTYIVQYNTGDNALNMGPYPFTVPPGTRYRVTVEDSPVTLPHPDSRLLQTPNHISPKDFEGWVQERGLYFSTKWDPHYETVMSSKDPGEAEQPGGELWTHYGKGVYIFTSYAWFRQLPAGVPGAYRLFANLLSAK